MARSEKRATNRITSVERPTITLVILWAIVMIFVLPFASKALGLHAALAGAWIGNSEFADAAGLAAAGLEAPGAQARRAQVGLAARQSSRSRPSR